MHGLRLHETRRARELHQDQSEAERRLWRRLRSRLLGGFKFVRQEPIGPFLPTSFAAKKSSSSRSTGRRIRSTTSGGVTRSGRSSYAEQGYRIARFGNDDVYRNIDGVLETILAALEGQSAL